MKSGFRAVAVAASMAAASFSLSASQSLSGEVQLHLGHEFFAEGRYQDALDAYRRALTATDPADPRAARSGIVQSALRVAEFGLARVEAEALVKSAPLDANALSLSADALWASGLFDEAESRYRDALATTPELARGRHGMARALAARSRLDEAM